MRILFIFFTCFLTLPTLAHWQLVNEHSQLNFVSIKKDSIAEVHSFKKLSGSINKEGRVRFDISLMSVETNIGIRNERMKKFLFETDKFQKASFSANVDMAVLAALPPGNSSTMETQGLIDLHGRQQPVTFMAVINKNLNGDITVGSLKPIIVNASAFDLVAGINQLKTLAKLPNISVAVPVTFLLTFKTL